MDQIQKAIFSITAVILAGVWGYGGDSFASQVKSWVNGVSASTEQLIEESTSSENTQAAAPTSTTVDSVYQQATPSAASVPTNARSTKSAIPANPTPPTNPYAAMSAGNLKSTMGTMAPSSSAPQRSNAYFDKLSEQLRDLQGENPPPAVEEPEEIEEVSADSPESPSIENEENPDYATDIPDEPLDETQEEGLADELEELLVEEGY